MLTILVIAILAIVFGVAAFAWPGLTWGALVLLYGQKTHAHRIFASRRQFEPGRGAFAREEFVWNLNQHTGAVAGLGIAAAGAAMRQIFQNLNWFAERSVVA